MAPEIGFNVFLSTIEPVMVKSIVDVSRTALISTLYIFFDNSICVGFSVLVSNEFQHSYFDNLYNTMAARTLGIRTFAGMTPFLSDEPVNTSFSF